MNKSSNLAPILTLLLLFSPLGWAGPKTVAVMPFENINQNQELDWLSYGISETIVNDLLKIKGLVLVERLQIQKILEEQKLQMTGAIDQDSAITVGKLMGASVLVVGAFQKMGETIRLTARFVDTLTGAVLQTAKATGPMSNIFKLQDKIVKGLAKNLNIELKQKELEQIAQAPTKSLEAYRHFGQGTLHLTKRDFSSATKELRKATQLDPQFSQAQDKFKEVFWSLSKGNSWTYDRKTTMRGGIKSEVTSKMTRRAGGLEEFNGQQTFSYKETGESQVNLSVVKSRQKTELDTYYTRGKDGIYMAGMEIHTTQARKTFHSSYFNNPPYLLFPYEFKVGDFWTSQFENKAFLGKKVLAIFDVNQTAEVLRSETIKVPAGSFNSYVIQITQNQRAIKKPIGGSANKTTMTFWFAPGIGILQSHITIEMTIMGKETIATYDETLESYTIN